MCLPLRTSWNSIPIDLKKNPSWANTHSLTDWLSPVLISSRRSNQIWVEHTKHYHRFQQTGCTPPLCKLDCLLNRRSSIYRDHNTSPLREVQLFTSTWSSNQLLESPNTPYTFIRVASPNSCAFTAAYIPYPRDQAYRNSLKWAPSSSSTCDWIFSSEST